MGGSNSKDNLVVLTGKEHFICHYLLKKIYPESDSMVLAFNIMCGRTAGKTAGDYAGQREAHSLIAKSRIVSEETREKIRANSLEKSKDPEYIKKVSEGVLRAYANTDLREKVRIAAKENWKRPEFREKITKFQKEYWDCDIKRKNRSELIKKQNRENPELAKKRKDAIKDHQQLKSKDWIEKSKVWLKEWSSDPVNKKILSDRYFKEGSKINNSRKIRNKETGEIYRSMKQAAESVKMNYSTVKKYLYKNKQFMLEFYKED